MEDEPAIVAGLQSKVIGTTDDVESQPPAAGEHVADLLERQLPVVGERCDIHEQNGEALGLPQAQRLSQHRSGGPGQPAAHGEPYLRPVHRQYTYPYGRSHLRPQNPVRRTADRCPATRL
ncbi:hypothetical protein FBY35_1326 [Streptomyces sp. SLBN-118]|uniref:hypothetical protein n=1 Tax=Streptomyces sp. SLBN-118 TaxID=2768454 RepID=UPI0011540F89|nr:hypothetical protein [Streptomyces sp. SLBN-118]TQK50950.1 hypothetical protein FBY35_1326 [Streptomyces sp. SLBN-118]